jgi:UDP-glucose 4-epimerase
MSEKSRVLVTGGSGRLGTYVVDVLLSDYEVRVLDLVAPGQDVDIVIGSVEDHDLVIDAMRDVDAVVHLANLDAGVRAPEEDFIKINVGGTWNVLDAAEKAGVKRFVYASSYNATGFSKDFPPLYLPVDIHHPLNPVHAYGISKLLAENMCETFSRRSGMEVVCLRPPLILRDETVYNLIKVTAEAEGTPPPPAVSNPDWQPRKVLSDSRAYVTSRDAARCFRAAIEADIDRFGIFNVMAPDTYSALPTLEVLRREYGAAPDIRDNRRFTPDSRSTIYEIDRTREVLGWFAQETCDDVLRRVIASAEN